jgi:hypothetical protein
MENDNVFNQLQKLFNEFGGNLNIINEKIDIDLQVEYFRFSENVKQKISPEDILKNIDEIFNPELSVENKKLLLSQLASIDDVLAFRTIEQYLKNPDEELKFWAILALQESKMLLQSKLLEQNQLFISTGLGGRDNMLRYFIVILSQDNNPFSDFQKERINSEFSFVFQKNSAVIEEIKFQDNISTVLALIPINIALTDLFSAAIKECNIYGNFIKDNGIITNVKILTVPEIIDFLNKNKNSETTNNDE